MRNKEQKNNLDSSHQETTTTNETTMSRREALKDISKKAGVAFAAPATLAILSMEAKACSFSC